MKTIAEGTSVGAVYLDFVVRDTITQQIQGMTKRASNTLSNSMTGYNKSLERAKTKVKQLEGEFDALGAKLDETRNATKGLFKGIKNPWTATEDFLASDKAYQKLIAQQDALGAKMAQAQESLRIETDAAAAKTAAAQEKAQAQAAAAAEKAKARQEAAVQKAAEAEKRAAKSAAAAQERAQAQAAKESERQWRKSTKSIRSLFRTMGSTLKATFLTAGLYAFFRAAKSLMAGAAGQSKGFSAALEGVKSNLATAFAPIMTAVMPMLTSFMQGLANVTRTVASFVASIFGQTYAQAQKAGEKLKSVTGAAKKAGASLGIDELNVIQDDDAGGASSAIADTGQEMNGLMALLEAFWQRFNVLMAPSIAAWSAAWGKIKSSALDVWPKIQTAAQGLWDNGLAPLGTYLVTDFAPSVFNSFSEAFAPIVGDTISARLHIFSDFFTWICGLISDAINSVVIPALDLFKFIWDDLMGGIQAAWAEYGQPILDGVILAFQNVWGILQSFWDTIIKPFLQYLIGAVQELWNTHLKPLWDNICGLIGDIGQFLLTCWNNVLAPLIDWIVQVFGPYWEKIFEAISNVVSFVIGWIADRIDLAITVFRGILKFFTSVFKGDWQGAWDAVRDTVKNVWDGIERIIKNTINGIIKIVNGMISAICSGINAIINAANSLQIDIPDWVPFVGGKTFGLDIPNITPPQIPMLKDGGYLGPNQPRLIIAGDNQHEGEIVAPESKLRQAVAEGMAAAGSSAETREFLWQIIELLRALLAQGGQEINLNVVCTLDGEAIYRNQQKIKAGKGYPISKNPVFQG